MPVPENYCPIFEITWRMSLILLIGPQVSENLVSAGVKDQPLCTFVTAASCILAAGSLQNACWSPFLHLPWVRDALSSTAIQCCITLSVSPAGEVAQILNHKMIFSPPLSPWAGCPAWRDTVVSVKHVAATPVGSAQVNFKLTSIGHW